MKRLNRIHSLWLATALTAASAFGQSAAISYRGHLTEAGSPANGLYDMQFKLFTSAEVGGAPIGNTVDVPSVRATEGVFSVTLDFGVVAIFDGSPRFLEIAVSRGGSPYTRLDPRQQVASIPYAIRSLNAGTAATALNVASGSAVKSLNNLKDNVTLAAGPNVTLSTNGNTLTIASTGGGGGGSGLWSLAGTDAYYNAGNVGIGTSTLTAGVRLEVNGPAKVTPGGSGGFVQIGAPNGETGLSVIGANRFDLRFNGSTLKLVAGPDTGPPPPENGIAITTAGNVGIGIASPTPGYRLDVNGPTRLVPGGTGGGILAFGTPNLETGMTISGSANNRADLRFDGSVLKLVATAAAGPPPPENGIAITTTGNVGIGTTAPGAKLHAETSRANTAAVYGNATGAGGVGVYGQSVAGPAIHADGNATQAPDKGGFVKAMALINPLNPTNQYVVRCYNSQVSGSTVSTSPCGFTLTRLGQGQYYLDVGFNIDGRFFSITPVVGGNLVGIVPMIDNFTGGNRVYIALRHLAEDKLVDTAFYILVY